MASSIICGLALAAAGQAFAQAASPASAGELIVTGSRIKGVTNATSPSPISVVNQDQIQQTKALVVEDVLSRMTGVDFTNGLSNASNNGGNGLSQVGLRGLGPARSVILVDGQRLIPVFATTASLPDLNSVPLSMVDHVEVLRDGASSIYGADAIGGVINIITKKKFDGLQIDGSYGTSGHGDANTHSVSATLGMTTDKGNVLVSVGWDKRDPLDQSRRAWAVDPHLNAAFGEGGSAYRSQIDLLQDENSNLVWANGVQYTVNDAIVATLAPNLVYLPHKNQVKLNSGGPGWNALTGGVDRKQISFNGHYDVSDNITFIAEGFFNDRTSDQSLRPEPLLGDAISTVVNGVIVYPGFIVPANAPGNTTGQAITAFLTPVQFGPRMYHQDSKTFRIHTGFQGTIADKFDWELGYVDQENTTRTEVRNEGNFNHLGQITGQFPCIDVPGGCTNGLPTVMPNFFNGPNMFTPAQVAYLTFTNTDNNDATERVAYANISGPLFELPYGTLKGAIGVEYRQEHGADRPDALVQEGFAPNPSGPTAGGYHDSSIYGELSIPLLANLPFAKSLIITPSGRFDHYSNFGDAKTYKIGVDYQINDDFRLRASYSTGFRAPSVAELFAGQAISDITASGDPCDTRAAGFNGNANVGKGLLTAGSQCAIALAGVPGAVNGGVVTNYQSPQNAVPSNQEQVLIGGNPNLQPEHSRSYGVGAVLTPHFFPGFSAEVDYFNTRITNTILIGGVANTSSPDLVLLGCYGPAQDANFCKLVTRNAAGTIVLINSLNDNIGVQRVEGIDYQFSYDTGAAGLMLPFPGAIRFDLQVSQLLKETQIQADGSIVSYPGKFQYSNEAVYPKWKGTASLDYRQGPWGFHWDTRYIDHMTSIDGGPLVYGNKTPAMVYNDMSIRYNFHNVWSVNTGSLTFGVDNVFDKDPPFLSADSICKCNSLAGPYDFVGRFFFGRVSAKF